MIRTICIFSFLLTFSISTSADDAGVAGWGDNLHPVQETRIELKKEILNIAYRDKWYVDVYFEFNNPDAERTLKLAFVTRSDYGDVEIENRVEDFTVQMNGKALPYTRVIGKNLGDDRVGVEDSWEYFVFDTTFPPGISTIHHTYNTDGGNISGISYFFDYLIETGGLWAGGTIHDFTLNLHFAISSQYYLELPASLASQMELMQHRNIDVTATTLREHLSGWDNDRIHLDAFGPGHLKFHAANYHPEGYIDIHITRSDNPTLCHDVPEGIRPCSEWMWAKLWLQRDHILSINPDFEPQLESTRQKLFHRLHTMDREMVRMIRNLPFAQAGYEFTDPVLATWYGKQYWYHSILDQRSIPPDPADIHLSEAARKLIQYIDDNHPGIPSRFTPTTYDTRSETAEIPDFIFHPSPFPKKLWDTAIRFLNLYWETDSPDYQQNYVETRKHLWQQLQSVDRRELRIIRNLPFALAGCTFQSDDLNSFFLKCPWYKARLSFYADQSRSPESITLTPQAKELIAYIRKLEKQRKRERSETDS